MHRRWLLALLIAAVPLVAGAQPPTFEVASIKRNNSGSDNASVRGGTGGRITISNNTLWNIIRNAWGVQGFQIAGGADWVNKDRWDIIAKAEGDPQPQQYAAMVQTLLADRFKLVVHRETRDMPIYALVAARGDGALGPQLHRSSTDCAALAAEARARGQASPPSGAAVSCGMRVNTGRVVMNAESLRNLVRNLAPFAGRLIVDKTGLTEGFDAELTWNDSEQGPSLFTALQEQLGLKLEPQRGPVELLVIDSAKRPIED